MLPGADAELGAAKEGYNGGCGVPANLRVYTTSIYAHKLIFAHILFIKGYNSGCGVPATIRVCSNIRSHTTN
jgi:hypothetical protein